MSASQKAKIVVYACGGAALNLGPKINHPDVEVYYVDTSMANRNDGVDASQLYQIPGVDGAGQNRKMIYRHVQPHIEGIIKQFEPGDFNIVLFSASGGSGSTVGPLMIRNLLEQGHTTMASVIGASDSAKFLENTINTLKSLEAISAATGAPVLMNYHENQQGIPQSSIDAELLFGMETLFTLADQNNLGLDTQDIHNWVNYNLVSPVQPQLAALSIYDTRQQASQAIEPIATLSLYDDKDKANAFGNPYYTKTGSPRTPRDDMPDQLHFVITTKLVEEFFSDLTSKQLEMNKAFSAYRNRKALVDVDDVVGDDGLVL